MMPKVHYIETTAHEIEDWADQLLELSQSFAAAATIMRTLQMDEIPLGAKEQTTRGVRFVAKGAIHLDQAVRECRRQLKAGRHEKS